MAFASAVAAFVANASVRTVVLAALAGLVLLLFRVRRADLRHAVWTFVLAAMLAAPLLMWLAPALTLHVGPPSAAGELPLQDTPEEGSATPLAAPAAPARWSVVDWANANWPLGVFTLYAAGVLFMLGRFSYGYALARKLERTGKPVALPLHSSIPVAETDCITVPVTVGWMKPRILLPAEWREWSKGKLRAVLAHESTHVRRGDYLISMLANLNRALYWFHPLAWWLERTLVNNAEQACDDEALTCIGDRAQYAGALLDMAAAVRAGRGRLVWEAMAMARPNEVRRRIELVLDETRRLAPGLSKARWAVLALACLPLVYGAAAVRFAQPEAPRETEVIVQGEYLKTLLAGNRLTATQAKELEARLRQDPEDLEVRGKLIAYYFVNGIRQPRLDHIFWLIEHHPETDAARRYSMGLSPVTTPLNDEADYRHAQSLWREQVQRHPDNIPVLASAAAYFASTASDLPFAIDLYKRCRQSGALADVYSRILTATLRTGALGTASPSRNPVLAEKIRRELETTSDKVLLVGVGRSLRNIAVPAGRYPAGRPHPLLREEHPELAPVYEYGDQLWARAEKLGYVGTMPPPRASMGIPPNLDRPIPLTTAPTPGPSDAPEKPMRIKVGGKVQEFMLAKRIEPVYPPAAQEARISGTVVLQVLISPEGKVRQIQAESGHPLLVPAATEAVRQWEYRPTLLNGTPVEVATMIEIPFQPPANE